jgi:hypothetical protein
MEAGGNDEARTNSVASLAISPEAATRQMITILETTAVLLIWNLR